MLNALLNAPSEQIRLVPQVMMTDESISSVIDRQAGAWGTSRRELVWQIASLNGLLALKDLDACPDQAFLDVYADKTGIGLETLNRHRARTADPLMRPTLRNAYCPICFEEDFVAGGTPYFRLDWARIFLTHCRWHRCPLFRWPRIGADGTRRFPHAWFVGEGLAASDIPQFQSDLMLAKAYACGVRPRGQHSIEAWKAVIRFEEWIYRLDIGSPTRLNHDAKILALERGLMRDAVMLSRSATSNGRLSMKDWVGEMFEDQRVMAFSLKTVPVHRTAPSWRDLRSGIQSMACRRAILFALATTVSVSPNN